MLESTIPRIKGSFGNLEFDPDLESIRDDPRFDKILRDAKRRLGVKEKPAATSPAQP